MRKPLASGLFVLSMVLLCAGSAAAQTQIGTRLRGFDEVPAISSPGVGHFFATISADGTSIAYSLSYTALAGNVLQSHIHIAQAGVNGGIMVFFCSNLLSAPAGTQACPAAPATVTGTITADNVLAVALQGVPKGGLFAVLRAINAGRAYANLHTDLYPGGEIRGQIKILGP